MAPPPWQLQLSQGWWGVCADCGQGGGSAGGELGDLCLGAVAAHQSSFLGLPCFPVLGGPRAPRSVPPALSSPWPVGVGLGFLCLPHAWETQAEILGDSPSGAPRASAASLPVLKTLNTWSTKSFFCLMN